MCVYFVGLLRLLVQRVESLYAHLPRQRPAYRAIFLQYAVSHYAATRDHHTEGENVDKV